LLLLLAGCSFQPVPIVRVEDAAGPADAPVAIEADAPPAAPDAPAPADAAGDPCPVESIRLVDGVRQSGSIGGPSRYTPTCAAGAPTGGEDFFHIDVPAGEQLDLVVDVDERGDLDSIVDVTPMCAGENQPGGFCEDVAPAGAGEVAVDQFAAPGRKFIAVDSRDGGGNYDITAYVRQVVAAGASCAPLLTTSRCASGEHCLDLDDDGAATCVERDAISDTGGNDDPCTTAVAFADDGVFNGVVEGAGEVDVIALDVVGSRRLRVVVHDGRGGCAVDTRLELLGGACGAAEIETDDDDDGLGPCPLLDRVPVPPGRSWLRIAPAAGAKLRPAVGYVATIDLLDP
jgi:hypothetical protein